MSLSVSPVTPVCQFDLCTLSIMASTTTTSPPTHLFPVDLGQASERAWNALIANTNPNDPILLVHSPHLRIGAYFRPKFGAQKQEFAEHMEQIITKYTVKCKEANRSCSFSQLSHHVEPGQLAERICEEAEVVDAVDVWIGSADRGSLTRSDNVLVGDIASSVASVCPCSVHVIKEKNADHLHKHIGSYAPSATGVFDAVLSHTTHPSKRK